MIKAEGKKNGWNANKCEYWNISIQKIKEEAILLALVKASKLILLVSVK